MMKNLCTPVESEDIRSVITTNLDRAAKLNFAQVQQESHLEGLYFVFRQIFSDFNHFESDSLLVSHEDGSDVLHRVKSEVVLLIAKMRHAQSAPIYPTGLHLHGFLAVRIRWLKITKHKKRPTIVEIRLPHP